MALQPLTPEQRAAALAKARLANDERKRVKAGLKARATTLADVLDAAAENEPVARMKVSQLLEALPGVGKARAKQAMERIGIPAGRRVRGLGGNQVAALKEEFAAAGA